MLLVQPEVAAAFFGGHIDPVEPGMLKFFPGELQIQPFPSLYMIFLRVVF